MTVVNLIARLPSGDGVSGAAVGVAIMTINVIVIELIARKMNSGG